MSEETLLTAARRAVRFFRFDDSSGGGLISRETTQAMEILDLQIHRETIRLKKERGDDVSTEPGDPPAAED